MTIEQYLEVRMEPCLVTEMIGDPRVIDLNYMVSEKGKLTT